MAKNRAQESNFSPDVGIDPDAFPVMRILLSASGKAVDNLIAHVDFTHEVEQPAVSEAPVVRSYIKPPLHTLVARATEEAALVPVMTSEIVKTVDTANGVERYPGQHADLAAARTLTRGALDA